MTLRVRTATGTMVLVALCLAGVALTATPAVAQTAYPSAETLAVQLINQERDAWGLRPLARNLQMVRHARDWSVTMASQGQVEHRPDLAVVVDGDYQRLGENVGFTKRDGATAAALVRRLHDAFMQSSGHRHHVLGDYNMVGVGIYRGGDGSMWMTVNFIKGPRDGFPLYSDIGGKLHKRVGRLFDRGVIDGCGGNRYCPKRATTRAEISRTLYNATGNRQAAAVMADSCTSRTCATEPVTKVEAARMLASALRLEPVDGARFVDVSRDDRGAVNAVVDAGILSRCDSFKFCSDRTITRARLAGLLRRALR